LATKKKTAKKSEPKADAPQSDDAPKRGRPAVLLSLTEKDRVDPVTIKKAEEVAKYLRTDLSGLSKLLLYHLELQCKRVGMKSMVSALSPYRRR